LLSVLSNVNTVFAVVVIPSFNAKIIPERGLLVCRPATKDRKKI